MVPLRIRCGRVVLAAHLLLLAGCRHKAQIPELTQEFIETALSFSPSAATAAGFHQYKNQNLDGQLDDMGEAAMDRHMRFYRDFQQRLQKFDPKTLNQQDRADLNLMLDRCGLELFDLVETRSYLHNPLRYIETLGNALYTPYILDYAPKAERFRHISSRLRQVPLMLDQAKSNVFSAPTVWTKAAIDVNKGLIKLVDEELRAGGPPESRKEYDQAAGIALPAMRKFQEYMETKLQFLDNADWRLNNQTYTKKFRFVFESGGAPSDLLVNAQRDFNAVRARMFEVALPLHRALAPAHRDHQELGEPERQQAVIGEVLTSIAARHSTPESFMEDVRRDVAEARAFAQAKNLLTLPGGANLQVMPTPEFRRSIDAAMTLQAAPAFNPKLTAILWVAPVLPGLSKERVEAKLRAYNLYRLRLLALQAAVPGRYVQTEAANAVEPPSRRVLRSVFGARAYIQGWSQYSTQMMIDEGFPDHSPEMALTFGKEQLRILAGAILDVRLHALQMPEEEALTLLKKGAFQETEEAADELRHAMLTSCELPGYYVGAANWVKAGAEYQSSGGRSPAEFYNRALQQGAVPLSQLGRVLGR